MSDGVMNLLAISWIMSAVLGGIVGAQKNIPVGGAIIGLIFGPLGLVASFALDGRPQCHRCCGRLDMQKWLGKRPQICQHCGAKLHWREVRVGAWEPGPPPNQD